MKKMVIFEIIKAMFIVIAGMYYFSNVVEWTDYKLVLALGYIAFCIYTLIKDIIVTYKLIKFRNSLKEDSLSDQRA